ncbi:hypothetical protein NP233_g3623 [Leucocoprinus birnbaumii]|uniref:Uncharacterized protein n=1 Tax=Leucocoprinus birnbaumii TaxID=56174 RepID=A0AAD5VW74_9AGAR|nr:hypothetical protein NP233_g3623 [Leucocoprinus birnbaumii]
MAKEQKDKTEPKKKARAVPMPTFDAPVTQGVVDRNRSRSVKSLVQSGIARDRSREELFVKWADRVRIEATLAELSAAPKKKILSQANALLGNGQPAIACSTIYEDREGHPILAYYATRTVDRERSSPRVLTLEEQYSAEGRTQESIDELVRGGQHHTSYDGIPPALCEEYRTQVQALCAGTPPKLSKTEKRHPDDDKVVHTVQGEALPGGKYTAYMDDKGKVVEAAGVHHLVHCWKATGQKKLSVSKCVRDTSHMYLMLPNYYSSTTRLAAMLGEKLKSLWPEFYDLYERSFKAGVTIKEDPGPFLARAIVYKVQIGTHVDKSDAGPSVCFPCGDWVSGGELVVPQLGAKFAYKSGDIVILYAAKLYHQVAPWRCAPLDLSSKVTPGRIGNVFFSPANSVKELKDKEEGWAMRTGLGILPENAIYEPSKVIGDGPPRKKRKVEGESAATDS